MVASCSSNWRSVRRGRWLARRPPSLNALAPPSIGGTPLLLLLELDDVDASVERASAIGAEVEMPSQEIFWGERYGVVRNRSAIAGHCRRRATRLTPDGIAGRAPPEV